MRARRDSWNRDRIRHRAKAPHGTTLRDLVQPSIRPFSLCNVAACNGRRLSDYHYKAYAERRRDWRRKRVAFSIKPGWGRMWAKSGWTDWRRSMMSVTVIKMSKRSDVGCSFRLLGSEKDGTADNDIANACLSRCFQPRIRQKVYIGLSSRNWRLQMCGVKNMIDR